jgi:hypothetical protein
MDIRRHYLRVFAFWPFIRSATVISGDGLPNISGARGIIFGGSIIQSELSRLFSRVSNSWDSVKRVLYGKPVQDGKQIRPWAATIVFRCFFGRSHICAISDFFYFYRNRVMGWLFCLCCGLVRCYRSLLSCVFAACRRREVFGSNREILQRYESRLAKRYLLIVSIFGTLRLELLLLHRRICNRTNGDNHCVARLPRHDRTIARSIQLRPVADNPGFFAAPADSLELFVSLGYVPRVILPNPTGVGDRTQKATTRVTVRAIGRDLFGYLRPFPL